ncbi:MAG TPA: amino acid permease, partial [Spirochaetes bacterium]|nr:amino acid permease [Spirochaetota bacterium]
MGRHVFMELKRELGLFTGILVVVASMIGTGIFVTTGNVLQMTQNAQTILILWAVGGLVAITGALCYAELATIWPDVGGEYVYLKKTFGLLPSFLTGWISLVVAFSASVATSSLTLIYYLNEFFKTIDPSGASYRFLSDGWTQKLSAAGVIFFLGLIHITGVRSGSRIQNVLTIFKFVIISSLILFGFYLADWSMADRLLANYTAID